MNVLLLVLAIILLSLAHIVKIERQSQFIEIYEKPPKQILSKALSITFLLNLIVPVKLGNIFRVIYPGRHLKNGKCFSLATIIIDILIDFFTITIAYALFYFIGKDVWDNLKFYLIASIAILIMMVVLYILKKYIKKAILKCACVFNESIKLKLLKTIWFSITAFEDMIARINKVRLLLYTAITMLLYMLSFFCLSRFLNSVNIPLDFTSVFNLLYGSSKLVEPTLVGIYNSVELSGIWYLTLYIAIPIVIIYLISYAYKFLNIKEKECTYIELLPHIKFQDKLSFLEAYFSGENQDYLKSYLNINRDVAIIQDYSAGSNATTMLCSKDGQTFYRKYSFGKDAEKLYEQIKWIKEHESKLTLTQITKYYYKDEVCLYDMPYIPDSVTCFNYVHTMPFEESWQKIKTILDELNEKLHSINRRAVNNECIDKYIDKKVLNNIEKIKNAQYIKPLLKYDYIYINGEKYHNLPYFEKYLNKENLKKIFSNDVYSDIHGDFTIENIICLKNNNSPKGYYIIDPNTGNVHDSPYLDYAKLLQSIHGGYEFLMNTKSISYYENRLDFLFTKSNIYYKLFDEYTEYLKEKFGMEGLKSIFYHEIVHWLRLMPYKIEKNGDRALLFYAGLIMVASDVEERFEK